MVISLVVDGIAIYVDLDYVKFFSEVRAKRFPSVREALAIDERQADIALAQLAIFLLLGIIFLIWFRRAYRNLPSLGSPWLRFKPGWAVGSWFVPLLNLIRPKEIANDIWRVSNPELPSELDGPALGGRVSPLIDGWWAAVLLFGAFGRVVVRTTEDAATVEELERAAQMVLWLDVAGIAATILWIFVVQAVSSRQHQRWVMLGETGTAP